MKQWTIYVIVLLLLVIGVLGCGGEATPPPTLKLGPNLLVETQGTVFLKRRGWTNYVPVSFGVEMRPDDLVRPDAGQTVTILCADLSLITVEQEGTVPCQVEKPPVLLYGEYRIHTQRTRNEFIPYILHPRSTDVLDTHPLLRWHDTGATSYKVAVFQEGKLYWEQSGIQGNEIRYPDDAPALQPGKDYLLEVTDESSNRHSSEDPARGLGFQLLPPEKRTEIEAKREQILDLQIDDPARGFALAVYYAGQGVRGEALTLSEEISSTLDAPQIHLLRGDLLLGMQLPSESAYQAALQHAERLGDQESQALAQVGLWRATKNPKNPKNQGYLDAAIGLYEQLGDNAQSEALLQEKNQSE